MKVHPRLLAYLRYLLVFVFVTSCHGIHPKIIKKLGLLAILSQMGGGHRQAHHYPVPLPIPIHAPHVVEPHQAAPVHHESHHHHYHPIHVPVHHTEYLPPPEPVYDHHPMSHPYPSSYPVTRGYGLPSIRHHGHHRYHALASDDQPTYHDDGHFIESRREVTFRERESFPEGLQQKEQNRPPEADRNKISYERNPPGGQSIRDKEYQDTRTSSSSRSSVVTPLNGDPFLKQFSEEGLNVLSSYSTPLIM